MKYLIMLLLIGLLCVTAVSAAPFADSTGATFVDTFTGWTQGWAGMKITIADPAGATIYNATQATGQTATVMYLQTANKTTISSVAISGDVGTFNTNVGQGTYYILIGGATGPTAYTLKCAGVGTGAFPIVGSNINYTAYWDGLADNTNRRACGVSTVTTENRSVPPVYYATLYLYNAVNNTPWPNTLSFNNITGDFNYTYFNITATGFCATYTGNGTGTNCTAGSGTGIFYNVTVPGTVDGAEIVNTSTHQAWINVTATQLFTNNTISTFNITNNRATNTTTTGSILIKANGGANNINITPAGNYSLNTSCTAASLTTTSCSVTGIYDTLYTIGARTTVPTSISAFSVMVTNSTLGGTLNTSSTTGGAVVFPLLRGYYYNFAMNATGYALDNVTVPANASTHTYNFTLYTQNTFNLTFRNETTNEVLTGVNVTLQLISDLYSSNYTTSNGTREITLLTPGAYTIRYYYDADVPRDYYVTLTSQSYNNINLYTVDESISNNYLPVIQDQNTKPLAGATCNLLRYYILSTNTGEYRTVEMAKTDTNGQAVFRVVPNIINYKLQCSYGSRSFTTEPTKFTASTNSYTLGTQTSPLTSIVGMPSVTKSLTYNNVTQTYTFTWADSSNLVSQGCLRVDKYVRGTQSTVLNQCTTASTGSIIYTVTDTNQTSYKATGSLVTNTEFSTYVVGPYSIDFVQLARTFGLVGVFLAMLVFLAFAMMGNENGTDGLIISGLLAMLFMGAYGFVAQRWETVMGLVVIGVIIIYKTRR